LTRPRNLLFNHATAQVDIHLAIFESLNRLQKHRIPDHLRAGKPDKPGILKDPHLTLFRISHKV